MRRPLTVVAFACSAVILSAGLAGADSQTVAGDKYGGTIGDIKKIVVDNGKNAVTTKVFGLGKPCGGAKSLTVSVQSTGGKTLYRGEAGCYSGTEWIWGLYDKTDKQVKCPKFDIGRTAKTGAYTVVMPRSCLDNAPDKIKVEVDGVNWNSVTGGHAGPTKALGRG